MLGRKLGVAAEEIRELREHLGRRHPTVAVIVGEATCVAGARTSTRRGARRGLVQRGPFLGVHQGVIGTGQLRHLQRRRAVPGVQIRVILLREDAEALLDLLLRSAAVQAHDRVGIPGGRKRPASPKGPKGPKAPRPTLERSAEAVAAPQQRRQPVRGHRLAI